LRFTESDDGSGEMDHGSETLVGFAGWHGDALELFEFSEEIFDEMAPFIHFGVDFEWLGAAWILRHDDFGTPLIKVRDDGIAVKSLVGEQGAELDARDQRFYLRARPPAWRDRPKGGSSDHGMGRSRGGLTSKLHALVDAEGRPVGLRLTDGQVHDACEAEALIAEIPEGATLLGDKGYDSNAIREASAARGVWANIPNRSNRKSRFGFSPWLYKQRNLVERFFNRIKQFRGIATRYDKDPANFMAAVKLICVRIWCAA